MFLTHIDKEGNDSPAILIPNSTAYNRAVNLPEFVNTSQAGIQDIQVPAVDYRRYLDKGKELILKRDWDEALAELKKSLEEKPDFAMTLGGIGYILSEQGEVEEALQYLEKALKRDPNHYLIHSMLGAAYINLENLPRAKRHFQTAYELNPRYYLSHFNLGNIESAEGRPEKAIPFYEKTLELNPECKEARLNLGLTLNRLGDFSRAIEHLNIVVQNNPEIFQAHWALAVALNRVGDVKGAIAEYEIVLELSPDEPNSLNNLGWILATNPYEELRDGDRAVELAERLNRKTDYKIPGALDILAAAYAQTGQFDLAEKYASISLQMTKDSDSKHALRLNLLRLYKDRKPYPVQR
jgi:tetratricopeptide (TPR) repeat protein